VRQLVAVDVDEEELVSSQIQVPGEGPSDPACCACEDNVSRLYLSHGYHCAVGLVIFGDVAGFEMDLVEVLSFVLPIAVSRVGSWDA